MFWKSVTEIILYLNIIYPQGQTVKRINRGKYCVYDKNNAYGSAWDAETQQRCNNQRWIDYVCYTESTARSLRCNKGTLIIHDIMTCKYVIYNINTYEHWQIIWICVWTWYKLDMLSQMEVIYLKDLCGPTHIVPISTVNVTMKKEFKEMAVLSKLQCTKTVTL